MHAWRRRGISRQIETEKMDTRILLFFEERGGERGWCTCIHAYIDKHIYRPTDTGKRPIGREGEREKERETDRERYREKWRERQC